MRSVPKPDAERKRLVEHETRRDHLHADHREASRNRIGDRQRDEAKQDRQCDDGEETGEVPDHLPDEEREPAAALRGEPEGHCSDNVEGKMCGDASSDEFAAMGQRKQAVVHGSALGHRPFPFYSASG